MMILQVVSNLVLPILAYTIPYFCETNTPYSLEGTLAIFMASVTMFVICWASCGTHFAIRNGVLLGLIFQAYNRKVHERDHVAMALGIAAILYYLTSINKQTSQNISSFKTIFFDWLILIVLFPATGFMDLYMRSSLFPLVVAYFLGANMLGMGLVKLAEFVWTLAETTVSRPKDRVYFVRILKYSAACDRDNRSIYDEHACGDSEQVAFTRVVDCVVDVVLAVWRQA